MNNLDPRNRTLLLDDSQPYVSPGWGNALGSQAKENRLFASLDATIANELKDAGEWVSLRRSQVLHDHGHVVHSIYFVSKGFVSVSVQDAKSGPVEVLTIGAGEIVGLPHLFGVAKSPFRATVHVAGDAFRIPLDALKSIIARHPALSDMFSTAMGAMIIHQSHLVACNARHSIKQRLARWLLTASDQLQSRIIDVTHNTAAQAIGVRRAGITTELGVMQAEGIVECSRGKLKIKDRERLEQITCNCYHTIKASRSRPFECHA